jgi:hypothetical protein
MPPIEVCVIHPGALSASSWARLASHLPAGTPVKVLELETISGFWAGEPELTVDALAERLRPRLAIPRERVLVGWGVGGAVADALAAPSRRVVVLDGLAPGATEEPGEAELLRSFAMYAGARRGRPLETDPAQLQAGLEPALAHILDAASASGALRVDTTPVSVKRSARRRLRAVRRAADGRQGRRQHRARQPGAGLGPLRARRATRQRRRPLHDADRPRLRRAPRDAVAALADAELQRRRLARSLQARGERAIGVRGRDERRAELGEPAVARDGLDRLQARGEPRDAEAGGGGAQRV